MIRRPPRSTLDRSSAASDVYKRQHEVLGEGAGRSKKEAEQAAAEQAWVELAARRDRAEAEARSGSDDEVDGVVEASAAGDLAD